MLLRLIISNHSSQLQCILQADLVPHMTLKGNDATLFAVFKPFIFVVVLGFLFFFFKPLQTKLRTDIIQMCLSILPGGGRFSGLSHVQL